MKLKTIISVGLMLSGLTAFGQADNSILSTGKWYKIAVVKKGIYKIDRAYLENIGLNPVDIDPRKLALYGNGGNGMLPQANGEPRPNDLIENNIVVSGEADGSFDGEDYLLFFGNSPDLLSYDANADFFDYEKNLYSDTTFYFLTIKETRGKRLLSRANTGTSADRTITYKQVFTHELDDMNLLRGGRQWFGETFSSSNRARKFNFPINNLDPAGNVKVEVSVMAQASDSSSMELTLNDAPLGSIEINKVPKDTYALKGNMAAGRFEVRADELTQTGSLSLELNYNPASSGISSAYLDYVIIQAESKLTLENNLLHFYNSRHGGAAFEISNAGSDVQLWDISETGNYYSQEYDLEADKMVFEPSPSSREFVAFRGTQFEPPYFAGEIANQNLHALTAADAIFITHRRFYPQAKTLAEHREKRNSPEPGEDFSVHVVKVDEIYNEFSSGMQDVTAIRDFIRSIYLKDVNKLRYVLLFGDCSYDYKNRTITQSNYVPVYEARNSLHPIFNFSSDDYFGFMDEHEGQWAETRAGDHDLELGIGRLPVKSQTEAAAVVRKIIRYETSPNAFGPWRNNMLFIADDGDGNAHQRDTDHLANYVEDTRTEFNVDRLFIDAYEQIPGPAGQSSPGARLAFEQAVNDGRLMINYIGHGNEGRLTMEKIIDETQISELNNRNKLPFLVTATCEFGNYDNPDRVSGGEKAILNPNGGAIALLTSTRPVYPSTNFILNEAYYQAAMKKVDGRFTRLGDIIRNTKNNSLEGVINRNYALLGDPSMRLAFPKYNLSITSINGKVAEQADTLRALSKIQLKGEVRNGEQTLVDDFNGVVSVVVYDKPTAFSTLGDEDARQIFDERDALLFKGDASVQAGYFDIEFIVPKNISYVFGKGKVSMYALSSGVSPEDANGANIDLKVGGSDPGAAADDTPPVIALFINDTLFVSGQSTGKNPLLLARFSDQSGMNISNQGFGQDISMTINDGSSIVLNNFYNASIDNYQEGWLRYPLNDLEPGRYTLTLRAYDTHNNVAEQELSFVVTDEVSIVLRDVTAYPNPLEAGLADELSFSFSHGRVGEEVLVTIEIINLQGREIHKAYFRFDDSSAENNLIKWDARDSNGNRLTEGVYIYKLSIQSTLDGAKNYAHGKLVIHD